MLKVSRLLVVVLVMGGGIGLVLKDCLLPEKSVALVSTEAGLKDLLKETLGLPDIIEASPKVPQVVFIDQVITHDTIETFPPHQMAEISYDTLNYKDHVVPSYYKRTSWWDSFQFCQKPNHCEWMVRGFLDIAGEGDHQIYLPSNSPRPVDNQFVLPYPQWGKVIRKLKKGRRFDIVNCSYSFGPEIYPHEAYEIVKRGGLVVVSAGNEFDKDKNAYRANYTKLYRLAAELNARNHKGAMLIVGAYDPFQKRLVSYSNRPLEGKPHTGDHFVSAPCFYREGAKAHMDGGTSIAAAYVTGVAALLMKKFPQKAAKEIAALLRQTRSPTYLVNYKRAVENAL